MRNRRFTAPVLVALAVAVFAAVGLVSSGAAAPRATIKAGLVSDVGKFNDHGFNQLQLEGLNRAAKQLHVTVNSAQSNSAQDYLPNFSSLIRQGDQIVIGAGFLLNNDLKTVAQQFPKVDFAITDQSVKDAPFSGKVKNVEGLTYSAQESSYLAGCLAGLMTKKQGGKNVIGVVGGIKIPAVDYFLAGYKAGAQKCDPGVKVLSGYSQTFNDQAACKTVAQNQIAKGSQVEFNVAGSCGLGTLSAAKDGKVWGIGVDVDQSYLGPYILTSVVKHVDVGVYDAIQQVKEGKFKGGQDLVFDLKNNGVGLGKTSSKVPAAYMKKIAQLKAQIISGKIKPPKVFNG